MAGKTKSAKPKAVKAWGVFQNGVLLKTEECRVHARQCKAHWERDDAEIGGLDFKYVVQRVEIRPIPSKGRSA